MEHRAAKLQLENQFTSEGHWMCDFKRKLHNSWRPPPHPTLNERLFVTLAPPGRLEVVLLKTWLYGSLCSSLAGVSSWSHVLPVG